MMNTTLISPSSSASIPTSHRGGGHHVVPHHHPSYHSQLRYSHPPSPSPQYDPQLSLRGGGSSHHRPPYRSNSMEANVLVSVPASHSIHSVPSATMAAMQLTEQQQKKYHKDTAPRRSTPSPPSPGPVASSSPAIQDQASFESAHEAAASFLLLAAAAVASEEAREAQTDTKESNDEPAASPSMKPQQPLQQQHSEIVSPTSQHSRIKEEDSADPDSAVSSPSHKHSVATPRDDEHHHHHGPPSHVVLSSSSASQASSDAQMHLPSVLHMVLEKSAASTPPTESAALPLGTLQWLPHGHAWRIVRWEALRRSILPRYFPYCTDENTSDSASASTSMGSIDSFLWHLKAWGFEEVTGGPDAGAYTHVVSNEKET
jgi:hypothetical protein